MDTHSTGRGAADADAATASAAPTGLSVALAGLDWAGIAAALDSQGWALTGRLLDDATCSALAGLYGGAGSFRTRVVMQRHGYGQGEYGYFAYPLPAPIQALRTGLYAGLAPVANRWMEALGAERRYPPQLDAFLAECHAAGQARPTPLLLQYGPGDYNHLHQDLYGDLAFPMQATFLLSAPGADFDGGEFVLVEQRPRMQSRVEVVPLRKGEGVLFAVRHRPARGVRGAYRLNLRHGVSRVRSGQRHTLGVIFHDAR